MHHRRLAHQAAQDQDEYKIGPEDILDVSVWKNEQVSRTVPVRPDGMISLPLLNDVKAAGLTPMQLRAVLRQKLAEYMAAPEVSVIVREVHSFKVSIIGQVQRPGTLELRRWTTVLDALVLAGWFTDFASPKRIVILRTEGNSMQRIPFNYKKAISAGGEGENFFLKTGDIVLVP